MTLHKPTHRRRGRNILAYVMHHVWPPLRTTRDEVGEWTVWPPGPGAGFPKHMQIVYKIKSPRPVKRTFYATQGDMQHTL